MAVQLSRLTLAPKAPYHPANRPVLVASVVSLLAAALWGALLFLAIHLSVWSTPDPQRAETARLAALAPGEDLDVELVARGERLFAKSCAQCHASDGAGVQGRGSDLLHPSPLHPSSLIALADFLVAGHPAIDPAPAPQPQLAATDAASIAAFVRSIEKPDRVSRDKLILARLRLQDLEREAARAAKRAEKAAAKELAKSAPAAAADAVVAGAPDEELDPDMIAEGATLFVAACSTCHGKDAKGLPNNGRDLTTSQFIARLNDENLVAFIKRGRDPGDPANTTKIAMPPKGGNPAISDDNLDCIVTYLRSLQRAAKAGH